ncbi:MAG: hypothetical protein JWM79_2043 [Nocardioides sp.]|nr:hypothetical protein [Nocardioides sp.]
MAPVTLAMVTEPRNAPALTGGGVVLSAAGS